MTEQESDGKIARRWEERCNVIHFCVACEVGLLNQKLVNMIII
jgi:hypothetical protein